MRGFLVFRALPDIERPHQGRGCWPEFLPDARDLYLRNHPSYFEDGPAKPARPSPYEIDMAEGWLSNCKWMWGTGCNQRDWEMFKAYAMGRGIQSIADEHYITRQHASNLIDMIFQQIEIKSNTCNKLVDNR